MYVVKIINSIKARGKRPEMEYKFVGELTEEVRQQWKKIFSHAEKGVSYELFTFEEYEEREKKDE